MRNRPLYNNTLFKCKIILEKSGWIFTGVKKAESGELLSLDPLNTIRESSFSTNIYPRRKFLAIKLDQSLYTTILCAKFV